MTISSPASASATAKRMIPLILLALAMFALSFGRAALGPLQESISVALTLTDNQVALLQGAALAIPLGIAAVPVGLLVDRYFRSRLLTAFLALNVVAMLLTASATGFTSLFLARCLVGLMMVGATASIFSLLSDFFPASERGRATMVTGIGGASGAAAVFAAGGWMISYFGTSEAGWRYTMVLLALPITAVCLLSVLIREPPRSNVGQRDQSVANSFRELLAYRGAIIPLVGGFVVVGVGDVGALVWGVPTLTRHFGVSAASAGAAMGLVLLVSGIGGPILGGVLADLGQMRRGPSLTAVIMAAMAVLSAPAGLFPLMPDARSAVFLLGLYILLGNAIGTMTTTLCIVVVPNELRGLCIALFSAVGGLISIAFAPLSVSLVAGLLGGADRIGDALALVAFSTASAGAIVFIVGSRTIRSASTSALP